MVWILGFIMLELNGLVRRLTYFGVPLQAYKCTLLQNVRLALDHCSNTFVPHCLSIFGTAEACNMSLASKISCLSGYSLRMALRSTFSQNIILFMQSSPCEAMRSNNMFRPVSAGGLRLVHLYVQLLVSWSVIIRGSSHLILRAFLQLNLLHALPELVVSSNFLS